MDLSVGHATIRILTAKQSHGLSTRLLSVGFGDVAPFHQQAVAKIGKRKCSVASRPSRETNDL